MVLDPGRRAVMSGAGDLSLLLETQAVLESDWRVAPVAGEAGDLNRELLVEALEERIFHLLGYNMDKLLTSMYILDIAESRFKTAMAAPTMRDRARALAEVVYDRETDKIASRRKYANPVRRHVEDSPRE